MECNNGSFRDSIACSIRVWYKPQSMGLAHSLRKVNCSQSFQSKPRCEANSNRSYNGYVSYSRPRTEKISVGN